MSSKVDRTRVVAVASGKGGTGKSLLAANISIFLATLGKRVTLIDGALGAATAHVFVGLPRPERTLSDALWGPARVPLRDAASNTHVPGLRLIAGVRDPALAAVPEPEQIEHLIAESGDLDADFVVFDLGPGTAGFTLDLFLAADVRLLIAVPEPTSVELCYRTLRAAFFRQLRGAGLTELLELGPGILRDFPGGIPSPLDLSALAEERDPELARAVAINRAHFRTCLVINAARSKADMEMGPAVASAAHRQLGVPMTYLGHLEYDEAVWVAVRRRRPLLVEHPESRVSKCIEKVTRRLLALRDDDSSSRLGAGDSHYELLEVAPTASFEDIRRANRRIRELYGRDSVVISGLYTDVQLEELHRKLDAAYSTLMDASKRKEYDAELFPEGVPAQMYGIVDHWPAKVEVPASERPPMPDISPATAFTGPLMRQVREARGIGLREIAERTKIGMAYLQAIEAETFKKLPAVVYVRGFLVEYAKMLGIDPDRVLDTYLERYRAGRAQLEAQQEEWP